MEWWSDGAGYNGEVAKLCVVNSDGFSQVKVTDKAYTNNVMEYKAMKYALKLASDGDVIHSDSALVVNQLTKDWKVKKAHLLELCLQCKQIMKIKPSISIVWVKRNSNLAGNLLDGNKKNNEVNFNGEV